MNYELFKELVENSLQNAEQWIEDGKLLIDNNSYGHAYALISFADEEIAKAYICWLVAEDMIPLDSFMVKEAFRKHETKLQILLGMAFAPIFKAVYEEYKKNHDNVNSDSTEEDLEELQKWIDNLVRLKQTLRNMGIYVDLNKKERKIVSPKSITKEMTNLLLQGVNDRLLRVRGLRSNITESQKNKLRQIFRNIPKEVWQTGEVDI